MFDIDVSRITHYSSTLNSDLSIDLSELPAGMYILAYSDRRSNVSGIKKLIKR